MIAESDGNVAAGWSFGLPNAPELLERLRTVDRRRIVTHRRINIVGASVTGHRTFISAGRPVRAPAVHNVILDQ
ncbi:hypothetical protein D3C81_1564380 [compost metagenome]